MKKSIIFIVLLFLASCGWAKEDSQNTAIEDMTGETLEAPIKIEEIEGQPNF